MRFPDSAASGWEQSLNARSLGCRGGILYGALIHDDENGEAASSSCVEREPQSQVRLRILPLASCVTSTW